VVCAVCGWGDFLVKGVACMTRVASTKVCAMPCYAVLCRAMPCYAVLCRAMPCCAVLCRAVHLVNHLAIVLHEVEHGKHESNGH
jgi:hypothetical protein